MSQPISNQRRPAAPDTTTKTVDLPGVGRRTYTFPTRFHAVDVLTARFPLPAKAVDEWLAPTGLKPVSFADQALGQVTVQHLGAPPDGMKPYTEASFAVKVETPDGEKGWHTLTMPVDSFENRQRGHFIFGYPKEMDALQLSGNTGSVKAEDGKELFSVSVHPAPVGVNQTLNTKNFQTLNGEPVELSAEVSGRVQPGLASVKFGEEMQRRYPGLPAEPLALFGAKVTNADVSLELPKPA